jgi:hypothetical protein
VVGSEYSLEMVTAMMAAAVSYMAPPKPSNT